MLADFYDSWFSNDMKLAVQKNHLEGQILYRSPDPVKNGVIANFLTFCFRNLIIFVSQEIGHARINLLQLNLPVNFP